MEYCFTICRHFIIDRLICEYVLLKRMFLGVEMSNLVQDCFYWKISSLISSTHWTMVDLMRLRLLLRESLQFLTLNLFMVGTVCGVEDR